MALLILTGLAFVVGVALVVGAYTGVTKVPGMMLQRRLDARLQEVSQLPEENRDTPQAKVLLKEELTGPLPDVDRMLKGTAKGSALARWIEQSGVKMTLMSVLLTACGVVGRRRRGRRGSGWSPLRRRCRGCGSPAWCAPQKVKDPVS